MTVKKCDRCGKEMADSVGYRRYFIFDNSVPHEKVIRQTTTSYYGTPLDLCPACYTKLFNFVSCGKEETHEED